MRKQYLASLAAATLLTLSACQKEEPIDTTSGAKRTPIYVENFTSDTKMTIDGGSTVLWSDGDYIQGAIGDDPSDPELHSQGIFTHSYRVNIDENGDAYLENCPDGQFIATFGAIEIEDNGFYLPDEVQAYSTNGGIITSVILSDGKQKIDLPMIAYRENGSGPLTFRHLSAAVNVTIWNKASSALFIDSIFVQSDNYALYRPSSFTVDITGTAPPILPQDQSTIGNVPVPAENKVLKMAFTGNNQIAVEATQTLQVPILPLGNEGNLTITVKAHISLPGAPRGQQDYTFTHTSSVPASGLPCNQVLEAKIKFDPLNNSKITTHGLFSVSSTKKVYFSRGNLTIDPGYGSYEGYNPFSFWDEQYKYSGNKGSNYYRSSENIRSERTPPQDLFCWGTGNSPLNRENYSTDIWGRGNIPIIVDGETLTGWTLLTANEWNYLFHTRKQAGTNANLYFKAKIYNPNGIIGSASFITYADGYILLPDDWSGTIPSTTPTLSPDDWKNNYEALGAVFLPLAGGRAYSSSGTGDKYPDIDIHTTGYYWISDGTVYHLPKHSATDSSPNALTLQGSHLKDGYTVRMVKTYSN